jgi:hypothetical protein
MSGAPATPAGHGHPVAIGGAVALSTNLSPSLSVATRMRVLVVLTLALPATLALVPGHPYGRPLRPRAAADVRWPGVVAMAEGDGGEAPTKRADELLRALQNADMRGVETKEEKEPDFFSAEGLKKDFALLRKGEGVRAAPSNLKRSGLTA